MNHSIKTPEEYFSSTYPHPNSERAGLKTRFENFCTRLDVAYFIDIPWNLSNIYEGYTEFKDLVDHCCCVQTKEGRRFFVTQPYNHVTPLLRSFVKKNFFHNHIFYAPESFHHEECYLIIVTEELMEFMEGHSDSSIQEPKMVTNRIFYKNKPSTKTKDALLRDLYDLRDLVFYYEDLLCMGKQIPEPYTECSLTF